ncbi:unnamed protein product [Clonostachys rosea f. rosea IK726]|uniref:Uncharacterized protein n=1 Tax=Clonostachys rosea f. rosea IK726 TaxID=1349383 RepID=A0ACA9U3Y6_BIOOC|nr:unnamed protein product [Clonostachys rosea f. rosea IK726]
MMNSSAISSSAQTSGEQRERSVILGSCDRCRRKKIRCVPTEQGCAQCTKLAAECHFTPIKEKKKPRRPAGYRYISELEERLKKMESLLMRDDLSTTQASAEFSISDDPAAFSTASGGLISDSRVESAPTTDLSIWMQPGPTEARTGFPNTSPSLGGSAAPLNDNPSVHYPEEIVSGAQYSKYLIPNLGPFSMPALQELPPKPMALEMVRETFQNFNPIFPLFDEEDFTNEFDEKYLSSSPDDPTWWACINVVLILSHRFRGRLSLDPSYDNMRACGYIHNALSVVSQLSITSGSLSAVQGLVGIAIVLQGTPNPGPSLVLISAAIRLAQSMNMHRGYIPNDNINERQREQQRRVFWIAYIFDKDISLRRRQAPAQDDDEMDVPLPTEAGSQNLQLSNSCHSLTILKSRISLAVIQGQIYKKLYSIHASRQSASHRAAAAQELCSLLSFWRSAIDAELFDLPTSFWKEQGGDHLMQRFVLRFTYVYCLTLVDPHLPPTAQLTPWDSYEVASRSEGTCIWEARKALSFLEFAPPSSYDCVWILIHPLFAAASSLLVHLSQNPLSPDAQTDLELVQPFIRLLEALAADQRRCSRSEESRRLERLCKELEGEARRVVNLLRGVGDAATERA